MPLKPSLRPTATPHALLGRLKGLAREYRHCQVIFSQGERADCVYYVETGKVKLSVASKEGREAVLGIVNAGQFFGEGSMVAGQSARMVSASSIGHSRILGFSKEAVVRALHDDADFARLFVPYLLARNVRLEEDLIDQLFNSIEKRLARALLLLAQFGKEDQPLSVIHEISQETLAQMVGASRPRVSSFLNKFRKLGFIDYNRNHGLRVNNSLLRVILRG